MTRRCSSTFWQIVTRRGAYAPISILPFCSPNRCTLRHFQVPIQADTLLTPLAAASVPLVIGDWNFSTFGLVTVALIRLVSAT
jgi:hypothetical protein